MPYWKDRLESAKTQKDFAQLLQDLPDNPTTMTTRDGQHPSCTEKCLISAPLILKTRKGNIVVG